MPELLSAGLNELPAENKNAFVSHLCWAYVPGTLAAEWNLLDYEAILAASSVPFSRVVK
jgi:hypothetical protein